MSVVWCTQHDLAIACVSNSQSLAESRVEATLRYAQGLTCSTLWLRTKELLLTLLHLAVMTAKLCGTGAVRAVIAENPLVRRALHS